MGNPEKINHTAKDSIRLDISLPGLRGRKSAGGGRSSMRMLRILLFAAAFCLAAVQSATAITAIPSLLNNDAIGDKTLSDFTISSGSDRILIVAVDDEEKSHVDSVMLGGILMDPVGGYVETAENGNATSLWVILDAGLPADGDYDIVVSGGDKPSVAAMLWAGLYQAVPTGSAIAGTGSTGGNTIETSVAVPAADSLVVGTSGHDNDKKSWNDPAPWTRRWEVKPKSARHAGATIIAATAGPIKLTETGAADWKSAAQFVAAFAPAPLLPDPADNPTPSEAATGVSVEQVLSWNSGSGADSHNVYFGTNSANPTFQGNQTATSFDPGTLAYSTTYYWRVDEVNAEGTKTGALWSFSTELPPPPGCPNCRYRRSITIDKHNLPNSCTADVTGFPVLVNIIEADYLMGPGKDGHVANASGYDIAFTDAAGTALYHEVERYDADEGTLVAWVKVPVLSTSADTKIYMVYGDSTLSAPTQMPDGVWDGNYKGVWHLNQVPHQQRRSDFGQHRQRQ